MCAWALGGGGSWIKEEQALGDCHEGAGAGVESVSRALGTAEASSTEVGSLYVVDAEALRGATTQEWGCRTHMSRGSLASWASVSPEVWQMAQGPAEEERTVSSCPDPWRALATPLACRPALRFSSSAFAEQPGCLPGLDRVLSLLS